MRTPFNIKHLFLGLMSVVLFLSAEISNAQNSNELSLYAKGLFSKLDYKVMDSKNDMENGLGVGLHYAYYLSENWSLGSGVEYQYYEGTAKVETFEDNNQAIDIEGENFEFRYVAGNYNEEQNATYLNIPLMLQYETSGKMRFFVSAGAKAGFKLKAKYEADASSLETSGYYSQYDAELRDPLYAGFGNFGSYKTNKSSLDLKTSYIASAESGIKFLLEGERFFYMGLFLDYGLNNIAENIGKDVVIYNAQDPTSFNRSSLLESTNKYTSQKYTSEVRTLAFGLKVRYAFGL